MLKFTSIGKGKNLILIPGGPGLSSATLRAFDSLATDFCVNYLDCCGTNDTPFMPLSLEEISLKISSEVNKLIGPKYLIGHSFGGILASKIAARIDANGLICLATPFTIESLNNATFNYNTNKNDALMRAEEKWANFPSDETFRGWLSEYGGLYFSKSTREFGKNLILKDKSSFKFFKNNRSDVLNNQNLINEISSWNKSKLFLAGENDGILSPEVLEKDAHRGNFNFHTIPNANHFLMWDQPELLLKEITNFIFNNERE